MLVSYITIALRNLKKNKLIASIEIVGLSIGMSIGLVLIVVIKSQFEYDDFHPQADITFRIITDVRHGGGDIRHFATTPLAIRDEIKSYSFIEEVVSIYPAHSVNVKVDAEDFPARMAYTDESFFRLFGFSLLDRHLSSPLEKPFTAVITKETAVRFFGHEEAVGKVISIDKLGLFTVTGVIEDKHYKSHIDYDILASYPSLIALEDTKKTNRVDDTWGYYDNSFNYVLLHPGTKRIDLQNGLDRLSSKLQDRLLSQNMLELNFKCQSIGDIYPSALLFESGKGVSSQFLLMLAGIAGVVLMMSMINYFNLSVAQALNRAKEVGIRKASGAFRTEIFYQMLMETIVRSLLAMFLAIALCIILPLGDLFENQSLQEVVDPFLVTYFFIYSIIVGVIAGFIPALVLSRIKTIATLNRFANNTFIRESALGKPLVGLQFTLSLIFVIVLLAMFNQSQFMKDTNYGFNRDNIYTLSVRSAKPEVLTNLLLQHPHVVSIFPASDLMGIGRSGNFCSATTNERMDSIGLDYIATDRNLITAMDVKLIAGRNFTTHFPGIENSIIINETAVRSLGFATPNESLGKTILIDSLTLEVVGVVKDFHYQSFKFPIRSFAFRQKPDEYRYLNIKVTRIDANFEKYVADVWQKIGSSHALTLDNYDALFNDRQSYNKDLATIGTFSTMALVISCLGLFGIILHSLQKRTREIGIRKVFGGSSIQILLLLIRRFLILIGISSLLGSISGYFLANLLTHEFVYRPPISFALILKGILLTSGIAVLLIVIQSYKAASENPVKTIKIE